MSCSFAGGCNIEVVADGLSTILKNDSVNNFISICDEPCEFMESLSDSSKAVCKIPKISTVYSNQEFAIEVEKEDLRFRRTFGNYDNIANALDNQLNIIPKKSSSDDCFLGGSFKANHVGMLSQVKYFLGEVSDKSVYINNMKFEGSSDNSTWTELFMADDNIHEGWNYYKWDDPADYPKYQFYRFSSPNSKGCLLNEIKMAGVETVDNT